MKGKAKLNWLRGNADITKTFHLYYRNFRTMGFSSLVKRWEITTFEIDKSKLRIGKAQEVVELEEYNIGPVHPYIDKGSGIIQMLKRSTSMMGGMRSKSLDNHEQMASRPRGRDRTQTESSVSNERVVFTLTNIENENIKIGISGTKSDGIFEFRKLLIANRVAGKVLTDTVDSAELVIGDLIGVGGAARIFEGTYFGMPVAIKRYHEINIKNEREVELSLKSQVAEILNLKELRHPNVVSVLGAFLEKSILSVLMERCHGSLQSALHETRETPNGELWSVEHYCVVVEGIANAMSYIHRHNVIHRDLKPANVLLTKDFQPKITDFGDSRKRATRMSINIGTPIYQAPEQIASDRSFYRENKKIEYDKSIDVYAFAIMLWELWTGDVPYAEMRTMSAIETYVSRGGRPSLADGCDKNKFVRWPRELKMLIEQCWFQKPNRRPTFDVFKQQWSVQFRQERVRKMIADQSARPWFCYPTYISEARERKQKIMMMASSSKSSSPLLASSPLNMEQQQQQQHSNKKRLSQMTCEETHRIVDRYAKQMNHRGMNSLSDLILKEDIEGSELCEFDVKCLSEIGLYKNITSDSRREKKLSQVVDILKNLRNKCFSVGNVDSDLSSDKVKIHDHSDDRCTSVKISRIQHTVEEEEEEEETKVVVSKKPIRELTSKELGDRLRSFGLNRVGDVLEKEGCNGDDFADFEDEDVDFFNIPSEVHKQILSGDIPTTTMTSNDDDDDDDGKEFTFLPSNSSHHENEEDVIVVNSSTDLFSSFGSSKAQSSFSGAKGRIIFRRSLDLGGSISPPVPLSPSSPSTPGCVTPTRPPPVPPKLNKKEKMKILRKRSPSHRPRRITKDKRDNHDEGTTQRETMLSENPIAINNEKTANVKTLMRKLSETLMIGNDIE